MNKIELFCERTQEYKEFESMNELKEWLIKNPQLSDDVFRINFHTRI